MIGLWLLLLTQDVRTFIPAGAQTFAGSLASVQQQHWGDVPEPWTLGAQVEIESCITLRHPRCWNPRAELKTSREYGFGFGQITKAYRVDGSTRFDKFAELQREHQELMGWTWEDRFDPVRQLLAVVLMMRGLYQGQRDVPLPADRWCFALSAYNGGQAGVLQDRLLCRNTGGCNPRQWFGAVEQTSLKNKVIMRGYGRSPFQINRDYVRLIRLERMNKYRRFWI